MVCQLNLRLQADLKETCGTTLEEMDNDPKIKKTSINCLQQYKEELKSDKCQAEVHRMLQRIGRDIRFDEVLADACTEDRTKFCNEVQPVRFGSLTGAFLGAG